MPNTDVTKLNQQINTHILDQASYKARAAGEMIVSRYDPKHNKAAEWAQLLQPSHDPGPPPPTPPPPPPPAKAQTRAPP